MNALCSRIKMSWQSVASLNSTTSRNVCALIVTTSPPAATACNMSTDLGPADTVYFTRTPGVWAVTQNLQFPYYSDK